MTGNEKKPWIAVLHVRPLPGQTGGLEGNPAGAFAAVLALARDESQYREMVAEEMEGLGLFIAEVENPCLYEPDAADTQNIRLCADRLSPEWPVQYHDFHSFPHDEA